MIPTLAAIGDIHPAYYLAPVGGIAALFMAMTFSKSVMKRSEGDDEMVTIAQAVRDGAMAYLTRQYKVVAGVFVLLIAFLAVMWGLGLQSPLTMLGVPQARANSIVTLPLKPSESLDFIFQRRLEAINARL